MSHEEVSIVSLEFQHLLSYLREVTDVVFCIIHVYVFIISVVLLG